MTKSLFIGILLFATSAAQAQTLTIPSNNKDATIILKQGSISSGSSDHE